MYLQLMILLVFMFPSTFGIEQQETINGSLANGLESYFEKSDHEIQFIQKCSSANLRVFVNPNYDMATIAVSFELIENKHKKCFSYFDVFLKQGGRIFDSAKVPNPEALDQALIHRFENVTCGVYNLSIQPCYNSWQCAAMMINYPKKINMSSFECIGVSPLSYFDLHHKYAFERKILTGCLICILLLLITVGVIYYHFIVRKRIYSSCSTANLKELELKIDFKECSDVSEVQREVFFINYHDRNTLEKVETLKSNILAKYPNTYISGIGNLEDYNDFLTDPCVWLDKKLAKPKQKNVSKKIIVVDSVGKMEAEVHENENEAFIDAIEKLYRNFAGRRCDYANVFVVHFGRSRVKMAKLSDVVEDMRYLIPNHLEYLYEDLLLPS